MPAIPLLQPQELEVHYILPALRNELAKELKKKGKNQKEIASLLGVSEAAVSQYVHEKRGADIDFTPTIQKNIRNSAGKITDKVAFIKETQQLLQHVWKERFICSVCHDQNKSTIPQGCAVCFE